MKKICDHPLLLTKRGAEEILEGIEEMNENDKGLVEKLATSLANQDYDNKYLNMDYTVSCKITFVLSLLVSFFGLSFSNCWQRKNNVNLQLDNFIR